MSQPNPHAAADGLKSGACGYVLKESRPRDLLEAIKIIHAKGVYINEMVSGKLIRSIADQDNSPGFSKKELEFLDRNTQKIR